MNLISDIKISHAKKFKEGNIKQATFLKSFKKDIFELLSLDYKPSEIKDYLEDKLDVTIKMNSFYAWLNYTKSERTTKQDNSLDQTIAITEVRNTPMITTGIPKNTMDVLSSTDYD